MHIDLEVLPDWSEVENILENAQEHDRRVSSGLYLEDHNVREFCSMELETCQNLLNLVCRVIKVHINSKSISLLTTYILNLERYAIVFTFVSSPISNCKVKPFKTF